MITESKICHPKNCIHTQSSKLQWKKERREYAISFTPIECRIKVVIKVVTKVVMSLLIGLNATTFSLLTDLVCGEVQAVGEIRQELGRVLVEH